METKEKILKSYKEILKEFNTNKCKEFNTKEDIMAGILQHLSFIANQNNTIILLLLESMRGSK